MKTKKDGKIFLIICGLVMLIGIIHGCQNDFTTTSVQTTTSSTTTSISETTSSVTTSFGEVTTSGSITSIDSDDTTTNINQEDELLCFSIFSNESGDVSLIERTLNGRVPRTLNPVNAQIKSDGSVNKVKISYDLENKTLEVMINDVIVYKNQKAIEMNVDAIKITTIDDSSGVILLNNLIVDGDETYKEQTFFSSTVGSELFELSALVSTGNTTLVVSFDFAIIETSSPGSYDRINVILGVAS